uniref:Putative tick ixostatin n=2 Tax=Ixodes ricinus TaxID=34613 RepID=V5IFY8_IXORI
MQLALFIVIVTFTHLACEVQSEFSPDIFEKMNFMPPDCRAKLREQLVLRCSEHPFQTQLVKVSECTFRCGEEHNNGKTMGTTGQYFNLKDGTPCGQDMICIDGQCIPRCSMPFVKLLKGIK